MAQINELMNQVFSRCDIALDGEIISKELLVKTDKSIESIMYECGFTNRTAFYKKFYEHNGNTPLQYRKNQK